MSPRQHVRLAKIAVTIGLSALALLAVVAAVSVLLALSQRQKDPPRPAVACSETQAGCPQPKDGGIRMYLNTYATPTP